MAKTRGVAYAEMGLTHRIHIVGASSRTGTTLLAECMTVGFDIDAFEAHEAPLSSQRANARIYLTKQPSDIKIIEPALAANPKLCAICMMRDPRDVIVSRHANNPARYWAPLRHWKERVEPIRRIRRHERFMLLRYEDLVHDPDRVQETISARMPFLTRKKAFSAFHAVATPSALSLNALGGLRPIGLDSIGRWREHLARVAGQIKLHGPITAELIEFGYEPDETWLSLLDGVVPDLAPSHWPEFPSAKATNPSR